MNRKIVKQGNSTLTLSLPSTWTKKYSLKAGDEIDVEEQERGLFLSTSKDMSFKSTKIDLSGLNKDLVVRYLLSAYKTGYESIELTFKDEFVADKNNRKIDLLELLKDTSRLFIGFELVEQRTGYCRFKDFSGANPEEFDNSLRRILFLLSNFVDIARNAIEKKAHSCVKEADENHQLIYRFVNYCLRLLNKKGYSEFRKTSIYYVIISELEELSDVFTYISKEVCQKNMKITADGLAVYGRFGKYFDIFKNMMMKFDRESALKMLTMRREMFEIINRLEKNDDVLFGSRIAVGINILANLTEAKISIEL